MIGQTQRPTPLANQGSRSNSRQPIGNPRSESSLPARPNSSDDTVSSVQTVLSFCRIGEYVREALLLCRSMSELAGLDKSLSEIALAAGFYDQSHFANAFKRYTGMTPSEFRRK